MNTDRDVATVLKNLIAFVDSAAFPNDPLPIIVSDTYRAKSTPNVALTTHNDGTSSLWRPISYLIHSQGLYDYCLEGTQVSFHHMRDTNDIYYDEKGRCYSLQEACISAALHEVRHRVQFGLRIPLVDSTITSQAPRWKAWGNAQKIHLEKRVRPTEEFDAIFVDTLGTYEFRRGRLSSKDHVGSFIRMTPTEFLAWERARKI